MSVKKLLGAAIRQLGVALDIGAQLRQRVGADAPARRIRRRHTQQETNTQYPKTHVRLYRRMRPILTQLHRLTSSYRMSRRAQIDRERMY